MNKQTSSEDLADAIHSVMKGVKPVEHAKQHIDIANKKIASPNEIHKHYDISGDLDKDKELSKPGVKLDQDADEDDLEYVKHKMGMDTKGEVHKDDEKEDVIEKDPLAAGRHVDPGMSTPDKRLSFGEYAKSDAIRREHLRKSKIRYAHD